MVGRGGSGLGWGYDRDENINNGSQMILSRTHISIPMQNYQEIFSLNKRKLRLVTFLWTNNST